MIEEDKNNSQANNHDILSEDGLAPRKNFFDEAL